MALEKTNSIKCIPQNMDRYFYSVNMDRNKKKVVHLFGNVYFNDTDETDQNYRCAEWTGLFFELGEALRMIQNDLFFDFINERVNYLTDISESEAIQTFKVYFAGKSGTELSFRNLTQDTPCGDYWSD